MKKITKKEMSKIFGGEIQEHQTSCSATCENMPPIRCIGFSCASEDYDGGGMFAGSCSSRDVNGALMQYILCGQ